MSRWLAFRLDFFLIHDLLERWLVSLTTWVDRPGLLDRWLVSLTDWVDQPGPSADDIEMQPELPDGAQL